MRGLSLLLGAFALNLSLARATVEQDYLQIYLKLNDAERLEKAGDFKHALDEFNDCQEQLRLLHDAHPDWQSVLLRSRLNDCRAKIAELQPKVTASTPVPPAAAPGGTNSAPLQPVPPKRYDFAGRPRRHTQSYPWKNDIVTTVFWLGEDPNSSGWHPELIKEFGRADDQYSMSGYASANHASTLNPFYVALPFNDLTNPELAAKWLPPDWARKSPDGKPISACKDRWVEIKNRGGRVCFAQWEDVGPVVTNDALYVFGPNRPAAPRGLDVSPAVAKYLGIDSTAITSWRFIDDEDVLPGMWLRYDEQAILFKAMHEAEKKTAPQQTPTTR